MELLPFEVPDADSAKSEPLSVTEVSRLIVRALADGLPATIRIRGEISGLSERNGHWFFSLRDQDSSIDAVMWASQARVNRHRPVDGDLVLATGRIGHWSRGGRTRLEVRRVDAGGEGDLRAAFLRLCRELRDLGWFDEARKKPLPTWPRRIGVVTSAQGAAVTDVIATARSRFPSTALLIVDVRVQGDAAAREVAQAIGRLDANADRLGLDAIIVTRGGGAPEDLEAFNDRQVAQAVFEVKTPIVAAIGHESDTTIIELVADARASTPTRAITLLLPDQEEVLERLESLQHRLEQSIRRTTRKGLDQLKPLSERAGRAAQVQVQQEAMRLESLATRLAASRPDRMVQLRQQQVQVLSGRLRGAMNRDLEHRPQPTNFQQRLNRVMQDGLRSRGDHVQGLRRAMLAVDPLAVLQRGYSLTTDQEGRTVRVASDVAPGDELLTRVGEGAIRSRVESMEATTSDSDTVEP